MCSKTYVRDDGSVWCRHRDWKRTYATLDDAWLAAFRTFVVAGFILVPYKCGRSKTYVGTVRIRITQNPYAFNPYRQFIGTKQHRISGCGAWHLTSRPGHVLSA